jgi:hypothetical protein
MCFLLTLLSAVFATGIAGHVLAGIFLLQVLYTQRT